MRSHRATGLLTQAQREQHTAWGGGGQTPESRTPLTDYKCTTSRTALPSSRSTRPMPWPWMTVSSPARSESEEINLLPTKILFATDGSPDAFLAGRAAVDLTRASCAEPVAQSCTSYPPGIRYHSTSARASGMRSTHGPTQGRPRELLDEQCSRIEGMGGEIGGKHLRMGQPLVAHAEGIIAMASFNRVRGVWPGFDEAPDRGGPKARRKGLYRLGVAREPPDGQPAKGPPSAREVALGELHRAHPHRTLIAEELSTSGSAYRAVCR